MMGDPGVAWAPQQPLRALRGSVPRGVAIEPSLAPGSACSSTPSAPASTGPTAVTGRFWPGSLVTTQAASTPNTAGGTPDLAAALPAVIVIAQPSFDVLAVTFASPGASITT